jgi:hypothetical protein
MSRKPPSLPVLLKCPGNVLQVFNKSKLFSSSGNWREKIMKTSKFARLLDPDAGLNIETQAGENKILFANQIIPALRLRPDDMILKELGEGVPETYLVGDCREPHLTAEAVADGARIGYKI